MKQAAVDRRSEWLERVRENGWLWTPAAEPEGAEPPVLILAHGAGAPMDSPFMEAITERLVAAGISVLRFEFPYMAQRRTGGSKRPPNPQPVLLDTWRQVYALTRPVFGGKLWIGGKSMGGRMASIVADELGVDGLLCLGYPFYAAGKPEKPRVAHLRDLQTPTLIAQGTRDALGNRETVVGYELSERIEILWLEGADHDLKPLKAFGSQERCLDQVLATLMRHPASS